MRARVVWFEMGAAFAAPFSVKKEMVKNAA
jgi:hypothetical protein